MQTVANEIYLPDDLYEEVVNRLVEVIPLLGGRDELVARLGEVTGIWPEHTRADAEFLYALAS
ncbi:hypothetical protein [Rhizobium sp. WYJ-E13]|uniref:hypothetical protein n=1 Tax=Rhizobium sp. WYJ-E13 TaxID=2849093 RepID=UPI001C1ED584|nr:hypothetical protein [Rhizobium sp. WYJ-E13]QWW69356.1 hypothetical protein KQ933_06535 [Rhizobium sp. WYJ-E13]